MMGKIQAVGNYSGKIEESIPWVEWEWGKFRLTEGVDFVSVSRDQKKTRPGGEFTI